MYLRNMANIIITLLSHYMRRDEGGVLLLGEVEKKDYLDE